MTKVTKNIAAIILAAGRGTRMNDDSLNKVCFDCAGMPVVRRIVLNMREAGINRFVVLVGHKPKDVIVYVAQIAISVIIVFFCLMNVLKTVILPKENKESEEGK